MSSVSGLIAELRENELEHLFKTVNTRISQNFIFNFHNDIAQ
jgi:hypothetical protein